MVNIGSGWQLAQASWSNSAAPCVASPVTPPGSGTAVDSEPSGFRFGIREERDRLRVERVLLVLAVAREVAGTGRSGKQVNTPPISVHGLHDRAAALDVHDDVGEGDQVGQQLVLQQRREVARAAHRQDAPQPRAGDVGFEEDAVLVVVDVAGGAARVRSFFTSVKNSICPSRRSRCSVSLPNAPGNDVVPVTAISLGVAGR